MLFKIIRDAEMNRDAQSYMDLLHEDYVAVSHASQREMSKEDMRPFIDQIFAQKELSYENARCLYENDDILVRHQIMTFADGSKEAVMIIEMKKDGKIIRTETGATPFTSNT